MPTLRTPARSLLEMLMLTSGLCSPSTSLASNTCKVCSTITLCLSWIEPLSLFHRSQRGDTRLHRSDSRCTSLNIPKHQVKHSIKICTMGFRLQSCFLRENCLEASLPITMAHLWCFRLGLCIVLDYSFANFVLICSACRVWTLKHHLSSLNDAVEIGALLLLILASCPHSFNINCFSRGGMDAPLDFTCQ